MSTLVHDLDLPEVEMIPGREAALAVARQIADRHWLARSPMGYALTRHADVVALLRDKRFHSALSLLPQMQGVTDSVFMEERPKSILALEGDEHHRLRRLVAPAFTPAAADKLRPFMRQKMEELVDTLEAGGRCELTEDVCEPYPIAVICELFGAPQEDWKLFSHWASQIFKLFNMQLAEDLPEIQQASTELDAYIRELIARRRSVPGDDLLSRLIAAEEAGDRLTTDEMVTLAATVLMAGTDTTRNQLACSVAVLAEHPDQWALLRERPELAHRAVEETMRYLGAVRGTARIASEDIEFRGVLFPAGTLVSTSLVAANMDPTVWHDPDTLDISQEREAPQLTFGSGIHFCLGAALARAELQEALVVLATRMPNLALAEPVQWKPDTTGIWGPSRLALRF
jgi:cytochrome P450